MGPLQLAGFDLLGRLVIDVVVPFAIVALGSYAGVLLALRRFFEASAWSEARAAAAGAATDD